MGIATGSQRLALARHHGSVRSLADGPEGTNFTTVSATTLTIQAAGTLRDPGPR
ncbi:hypothetical protein ACFVIM_13635 [Streptomyces sp. NPDC057638]|uniref:hypothetical protein n=1 Tax=Streptomyces sp. NPDC057638 TaxID=3346190 RepID=UPI0036B7FDF6